MYSSATAAVVLFSIYSRSSPYSTPPNDPSCATQQNVQQQDVRGCIAASYWDFHVFTIPRHIGVEVAVEVGVWARSFADETLCRVGRGAVARCGDGRSRGAREIRSETGHTGTGIAVKIQNETTNTLRVLYFSCLSL